MSSEGYLTHLDRKLGLPVGTIYGMCKEARNGKSAARNECKVTYKGLTSKSIRVSAGHFLPVQKEIFLIEGGKTDGGRKVLAQVFLNLREIIKSG